jgi:hypothetical protein
MDINAHFVRKIVAEPAHQGTSHWLDLKIFERSTTGREMETEISLFLHGPDAETLVERYAAAINSVNGAEASEAKAA